MKWDKCGTLCESDGEDKVGVYSETLENVFPCPIFLSGHSTTMFQPKHSVASELCHSHFSPAPNSQTVCGHLPASL